MERGPATLLAFHYRRVHDRVLTLVDDLSDAQLAWRPPAEANSIAWNLWHLARWSDHLQVSIPHLAPQLGAALGRGSQIWEVEAMVMHWGWSMDSLGKHQTGMLMTNKAAARLVLPDKEVLLDYARRTFAAVERALAAVDDEHLPVINTLEYQADAGTNLTVGDAIISYLTHNNRHLGEIECLRGLQGLRGTATR